VLFPRIMQLIRENEMTDVLVIAGGIIPEEDVPELKKEGIAEIFGPGTPTSEIVRFVRQNVQKGEKT